MKKTTVFLMSLILIWGLAACGGTNEDASTDGNSDVAAVAVADVDAVADTVVETTEDSAAVVEAEVVAEPAAVVEDVVVDEITAVSLTEDYAEALPIRNQLLIGTLKLENTSFAVSPEQAAELLVLWQASNALSRSGTGATAEVTAVLNQIEGTMTPEQISAIAEMKLTREAIQTMSQELGLSTGGGDGEGSGSRGQGQNLTEAEKAARQAEQGERASNGANNALTDLLIEMLSSRSQQ